MPSPIVHRSSPLTREAVLPPHTLRRLAALAALAVLHMAVVYGFLELARELFS